jgi:Holliday junction resolvase
MYLNKGKKVIRRQEYFPKIKNLESTCKACWKFYLNPRNSSIKGLDIQLGKRFENKMLEFLNTLGINCQRGDKNKKIFPDNIVLNSNGKIIACLEIKYQSAPWLFAFKDGTGTKECYESSPALDIKKLEQQWKLMEDGIIKVPVYYVYWLDIPCVKGVFFVDIKDVYKDYKNNPEIFERKARAGDYSKEHEIVKSGLRKIHISIYRMHQFSELIDLLNR